MTHASRQTAHHRIRDARGTTRSQRPRRVQPPQPTRGGKLARNVDQRQARLHSLPQHHSSVPRGFLRLFSRRPGPHIHRVPWSDSAKAEVHTPCPHLIHLGQVEEGYQRCPQCHRGSLRGAEKACYHRPAEHCNTRCSCISWSSFSGGQKA